MSLDTTRAGAVAFFFGFAISGVGCGPENKAAMETVSATPSHEPKTYPVPGKPVLGARPSSPSMQIDPPPSSEALSWTKPDAWEDISTPNPMRKATYRIKAASPAAGKADAGNASSDEDAELSVSQAGGDLGANIQRWAGQFKDSPTPRQSDKTVGALKVTIVEIEGTYSGMSTPGKDPEPRAGYALLAAIVDVPDAPYFFKLTGPKKTVDAARTDFDKLVASFKKP